MSDIELRKAVASELKTWVISDELPLRDMPQWGYKGYALYSPTGGITTFRTVAEALDELPHWDTSTDAALTLPLREGDRWEMWQTYESGIILWNARIQGPNGEPYYTAYYTHRGVLAEAICLAWLAYRREVKDGNG